MTRPVENLPLTSVRGLAALYVVAHHLQPTLWPDAGRGVVAVLGPGFAAVDVFFTLSGFILWRLYGDMRLADAPTFWLRRLCRVFPLHIVIMLSLGTGALVTTALGINRTDHDWPTFPWVLALLQPYHPGATGWNPPSWSVGVELACYASFPAAACLLRRLSGGATLAFAAAFAAGQALVLSTWGGAIDGPGALLRGFSGFYLGSLLARLPPLQARAAPAASWLAAAALGLGLLTSSPPTVALAGAALIACVAPQHGNLARWLSTPLLVCLGRISFSVYLLQAPLLTLVLRMPALPGGAWSRSAIILGTLMPLSALTYRFIEQPGRRLARRLATRPAAA